MNFIFSSYFFKLHNTNCSLVESFLEKQRSVFLLFFAIFNFRLNKAEQELDEVKVKLARLTQQFTLNEASHKMYIEEQEEKINELLKNDSEREAVILGYNFHFIKVYSFKHRKLLSQNTMLPQISSFWCLISSSVCRQYHSFINFQITDSAQRKQKQIGPTERDGGKCPTTQTRVREPDSSYKTL